MVTNVTVAVKGVECIIGLSCLWCDLVNEGIWYCISFLFTFLILLFLLFLCCSFYYFLFDAKLCIVLTSLPMYCICENSWR